MKTKLFILFSAIALIACGQSSPAEKAEGKIDGVNITIEYGSPRVKGRTIFGDLVPFGQVWRAGANKNTTVEFSENVKVGGQDLPKGKYGFFIIPEESGIWTVIFNKTNDSWGAYSYMVADDALRINVDASFRKEPQENLTFRIKKNVIRFEWSDKAFEIEVSK